MNQSFQANLQAISAASATVLDKAGTAILDGYLQPSWSTGFNSSPNIKATADANPGSLGTKKTVLSNPQFLAWHPSPTKSPGVELRESLSQFFFFWEM